MALWTLHFVTRWRCYLLLTCLSDVFSFMQGNATFSWREKRKKVLKFIVRWWLGLFPCLHTCYQLMFLLLTSEWSIEIFVIDHIHVRLPFRIIRKPPLWKEVLYRCIEILTNFNSQPVCFLTFSLCTTILDWKRREVWQKPALPYRLTWSH